MKENVLKEKSFRFAIRIVELYKYLIKTQSEYTISRQNLRSGPAIGAIIREAEYAESTKDFVHKFSIGLKEANETKYWLDLLNETKFLTIKLHQSLVLDCEELLKLLTAPIKTSKLRL